MIESGVKESKWVAVLFVHAVTLFLEGLHHSPKTRVLSMKRVTSARSIASLLMLACLLLHPKMAQSQAEQKQKATPSLTETLKAEDQSTLAVAVREQGSAVRGAILFSQQKLGCVNCHATGNDAMLGPDLTRLGDKVTNLEFVEALLDPSKRIRKGFETSIVITTDGRSLTGRVIEQTSDKVTLRDTSDKPKLLVLRRSEIDQIVASKASSMPNKLADKLKNRQEFLDLVRYVIEISSTGTESVQQIAGGKTIAPELQGLVLVKEFNCAACHRDDVSNSQLSTKQAPNLQWSAGRIDPAYVERFIVDPAHVKPGTTMPAVMASQSKADRQRLAREITHYLMSQTDRVFAHQKSDPEKASRGRELFHQAGCVACHSPRDVQGNELLKESSVPLLNVAAKYNVDALVSFLKAPEKIRASGRMPNMKLTHWEAIDLAHYLTNDRTAPKRPAAAFEVDASLAKKGKVEFRRLGCVQCHDLGDTTNRPTSKPLSQVKPDQGCLSNETGAWPRFRFSEVQRQQLVSTLSRKETRISQQDQIAVTLTGLRCVNCHQRGELGGVPTERNPHFRTTNPNLGPQGRIPPTLTNVGAKLNPDWMRRVLVSGKAIRPYVQTRMPQYGAANVTHLVDLFQKADTLPDVEYPTFKDQKEMRLAGHQMAGTSGLNCIACHTFQLKQAATMPAVDLTEMSERLKKKWFFRYMKSPQRFSPNTVMPSFWPGGRAIRKDILDGDPDLQVEALWQYLLDGRQARQPRGLIVEPIQLLASDEAVMLRRKYPNVGKRGIGVGYPHQINLVFDAEQMRLATLWTGKFADPGGVWRSQGHGSVRPLGRDVIQFAKGPDLDSLESPWIPDEGRPPGIQFRGYRLDEKQRPVFSYEFKGVPVSDYFADRIDEKKQEPYLLRRVAFNTRDFTHEIRLRLANGKSIVERGNGHFLVDGKLLVKANGPTSIRETAEDSKSLFLVPKLSAGPVLAEIEYRWPSRNVAK